MSRENYLLGMENKRVPYLSRDNSNCNRCANAYPEKACPKNNGRGSCEFTVDTYRAIDTTGLALYAVGYTFHGMKAR